MYSLLRLVAMTTDAGWRVLAIKPTVSAGATKQLAAFAGPSNEVTILGLDTRGATLNGKSATRVPYEIGGLPPQSPFALVIWNRAGGGQNVLDSTVATDGGGIARMTVPLNSVFALTSKPLPSF